MAILATLGFSNISEVKMKRINKPFFALMLVLVLVLFVGIFSLTKNNLELPGTAGLLQEDSFFKLYSSNEMGYYYELYNGAGKIIECGNANTPPIHYLSDSVIEIKISAGSGVFRCKYYDTLSDKLSEDFYSPILAQDNKVAYYSFDKDKEKFIIIIKDMFDGNFYYEYVLDDFSPVANPIDGTIDVSLNDNKLYLAYLSREDFTQKEISLSIA